MTPHALLLVTMLAVNPGECGGWLTGRATVALFDTEKREAKIRDL